MSIDLQPIIHKAELLLLELTELNQAGPSFIIVHNYRLRGADCAEGEEIARVLLMHRGRQIVVPLPLALRMVVDFLAHHQHVPRNATQIAAGMQLSKFYRRHGLNSGKLSQRKISRSYVKVYIKRLRIALGIAFREASLPLAPDQVLVSETTAGNESRYFIRGTFTWVHCNEIEERLTAKRFRA